MKESDIKYENSVGYVAKISQGYSVRVQRPGATHSVSVGVLPDIEKARRTLDRLANHPTQAFRYAYGH